jgi:beta-lactamase regulating signal transducer with metallopeptidase domain
VLLLPALPARSAAATTAPDAATLLPAAALGATRPTITAPALPSWLIEAALAGWILIAGRGLVRLGRSVARTRGLKASSYDLPSLSRRVRGWRRYASGGRRVELRASDACGAPCAVGLGRACILIPRALADTRPAEELESIVLHEYAHLARFDDWLRLVQLGILAVAGLHPALRLLSRQIDVERESACDDWVVRRTRPASRYAASLLNVAEWQAWGGGSLDVLAPSVFGSRSSLRGRVERLLDTRIDHTRRLKWPAVAAGIAALGCGWLVADATTPFVAFATPSRLAIGRAADAPRQSADASSASDPAGVDARRTVTLTPDVPIRSARAAANRAGSRVLDAPQPAPDAGAAIAAAPPPPARLPEVQVPVARTPARAPIAAAGLEPVALPADPAGASSPWARTADAGAAAGTGAARAGAGLGRGLQRAGTSVGSFFGRAGRSIADGFPNP